MDITARRLLGMLSSRPDGFMSINLLAASVKEEFGSAYYTNIYHKLLQLSEAGLVITRRAGRASLVQLNFHDYLVVDFLAQMEAENKINLLHQHPGLIPLYRDIDDAARGYESLFSIASADVERNRKLNRVELLVIFKDTNNNRVVTVDLQKEILALQRKHSIRIDSLIMTLNEIRDLICTIEANPVKEILGNKIAWFNPQAFWREIGRIARDYRVQNSPPIVVPARISNADLQYNLNRFGYREFGATVGLGNDICIEQVVTALLLHPSGRQREAAAVVLAKHPFKGNLLGFLSQKYNTAGNLLGILKVLQGVKSDENVQKTVDLLNTFNVQEAPIDKTNILHALETYYAT